MYPELTNLLPSSAIRAVRREYFMRLATVAAGLLVIALVVHSVLLFPSYLRAHEEVTRQQAEIDQISKQAAASQEKDAAARIRSIQDDIAYLGRLTTTPTASGAVRAVLSVSRPGIRLNSFTFTAPAKPGAPGQMTLSGTAATRDSLRQYVLSLGQLPYITKADLPISSYALESSIPFTITLTGTLRP